MIELAIENYSLLAAPLKEMPLNTLFARSIVEQQIAGKIFVDRLPVPRTFYVIHPYGMSLLFGESSNQAFNAQLVEHCLQQSEDRKAPEWMQTYANGWEQLLPQLFGDRLKRPTQEEKVPTEFIELGTRVNFQFQRDRFLSFQQNHRYQEYHIFRTNEDSFNNMKGKVVPAEFWIDAAAFCERGVGFSLYHEGELASTAYSPFIFDRKLEIGIETIPEFRGRGYAQYVCAALIDYCLQEGYEPVWSCNLNNSASYKLAQKLGFTPSLTFPIYRLAY